jgi:uncharacterized protein
MIKQLTVPFFTVLFVLLGFFLFTKIFGPLPFTVTSITTTKQNLFTVQGTGEETAIPDTALISLGVTKEATTVETAQNQVNQIIGAITKDIKKLGLEDKNIKTSNYSVNPTYNYDRGTQTPNGYSVNATIEIRITPIEKANQAIDLATKDGATQVGNMQFVLNEDKQKELENQARKAAIAQAKEKAKQIANEAGINLGRIIDVQESGNHPQPVYQTAMLEKADSATPPTELKPGENKISITVTLSYETH